jgi:hypothetical protein
MVAPQACGAAPLLQASCWGSPAATRPCAAPQRRHVSCSSSSLRWLGLWQGTSGALTAGTCLKCRWRPARHAKPSSAARSSRRQGQQHHPQPSMSPARQLSSCLQPCLT